jgi:hypothetical protein
MKPEVRGDEMSQDFASTPWFGALIGSISATVIGKLFRLMRAPDRDDLARVTKMAKAEIAASEIRTAGTLVALEKRFDEKVKDLKADGEARTARIERQIEAVDRQIEVGLTSIHSRIDGWFQRASK